MGKGGKRIAACTRRPADAPQESGPDNTPVVIRHCGNATQHLVNTSKQEDCLPSCSYSNSAPCIHSLQVSSSTCIPAAKLEMPQQPSWGLINASQAYPIALQIRRLQMRQVSGWCVLTVCVFRSKMMGISAHSQHHHQHHRGPMDVQAAPHKATPIRLLSTRVHRSHVQRG